MEIYDHDTPEEIAFKNNSIELDHWIEHLYYIEKEITNLLKLGNTELVKILGTDPVLNKLQKKKENNVITVQAFQKYRDGLPKAAECEDVDCDMFFVTEHEKFRRMYKFHLNRYRKVKEEYFHVLAK